MALFGKPRPRDLVALSIESTDIRFLSTKRGRVQKWGSVAVPPGLVSDGLITNALEMGKIVDQLFASQQLDRKHVVTSLTALRSIPRLLALPRLQASVLRETISREARKEMPISLENLYLSWQPLGEVGQQQRVYLLGVPRELVDAQVRALKAAGVSPFAMDLKPLALIRAVNQDEAIIISLERDTLDVILVIDFLPAIMRTFSLEREHLNTQGKLDRLLNELIQTVRFYNDSHHSSPLKPGTPAIVTGRLLSSRDATDYLKATIDRPIERPTSPVPCPDEFPIPEYMTNLGLAAKKL